MRGSAPQGARLEDDAVKADTSNLFAGSAGSGEGEMMGVFIAGGIGFAR